jgi:phage FluMu protein Com
MDTKLTLRCPKCKSLMEMYDEDYDETEDGILITGVRWYECPKCKTQAIVEREYKYYDFETEDEIELKSKYCEEEG